MTAPMFGIVDPDSLQNKIRELLERVKTVLQQGIETCWSVLKKAAGGGSILFPNPLTAAAIGIATVRLNSAFSTIWEKFGEAVETVWSWVKRLLGEPLRLWSAAEAYQNARAQLNASPNSISIMVADLGSYWSGPAFTSYSGVATEQENAFKAVTAGLAAAAANVSTAAENMIKLWNAELSNAFDTAANVTSAVLGVADIGKVLAAAVAPIGDAIIALGVGAKDGIKDIVDQIATDASTGANSWNELNAGLDGLVSGNTWPTVPAITQTTIDAPGSWEKAS